MTGADVGLSGGKTITLELSGWQVQELTRWAKVGHRSIEEAVKAAIDEYITPVETDAH